MFFYFSGKFYMGYVRVYSISDVIVRFYRLNGKDVSTVIMIILDFIVSMDINWNFKF